MGNKYPDHSVYEKQAGILGMEFIYETASFPQCHASTIAETEDGLVASWFGGTHEKNPDVGIWVSRLSSAGWSEPAEVANGVQDSDKRYPCWNPVLYKPLNAPLMLFYKVGPTPRQWWGVMKTSTDGGKTWSPKTLLPKGFAGPIKNKPIQLEADTLLCPSSTEDDGWRVHFETYAYKADKWEKTGPINDGDKFAAIQPTILRLMDESSDDKLLALCRTRQGVISRSKSRDGGKTWSRMEAAGLPNPNAGFDAVTLNNGKHLLVYNHTVRERTGDVPCGREMLNVSVSDDGINWRAALVLENTRNAEFSYPAVIQTADGLIHITYTWKRQRIKHVVIDFDKLDTKPIKDGKWPF
ncbi:putative neuraminidase (sialidase) [Limihaloglobus sulfuriphilus]|uniref:Putative neuraminidase (Sialidase) n=1 Tax=Limihaloglobus sulfuriphilus TaxID=1851148 RepID=A0A1Q2MFS9_9BACT|nr:sialidase family protein [Limihaloglobus sulfuriphilus]AQQ71520.1 putative neuraminidase (sialidase) [Limihaloglobus sulfuriphilus]